MKLEEVARRARVSTATVSRVLNNVDVVRHATRVRVMKAISDLNYHPNLHARLLAIGKSRTLGVIVSSMENPFFFDIVRQIELEAHASGHEVVVANTNYQAEQLVKNIWLMVGRRVAGLAVIVSEMEPALKEELLASGIPVVFYDVGCTKQNITNIRVNYRAGTGKIINYLHDLGHQRMAFVGHHSSLGPLTERQSTFQKATNLFAPDTEVRIFTGSDSLDGGYRAARDAIASAFAPTAIVCANDFMAVGVLKALREAGLSVPADISVTGFDNIKLSEFSVPSLTTMHIARDHIGHVAFQTLINPHEQHGEYLIEPELIIRGSSGPAPSH